MQVLISLVSALHNISHISKVFKAPFHAIDRKQKLQQKAQILSIGTLDTHFYVLLNYHTLGPAGT